MEQEIQIIQDQYGQLMLLLSKLQGHLPLWQEAQHLMQQLNTFYSSPQWLAYYENADNIHIDTKGHYSVLSQDTIWNALVEYQELTQQLKNILKSPV